MNASSTCPTCGTPIAAEVLGGKCPACLQRVALMEPTMPGDTLGVSRVARRNPSWEPPSVEELAALLPHGLYSVENFIGRGGMGAVYKGMQTMLKRPVAIKIMRQDHAANDEFKRRFEREVLALAKLNHPNIVAFYDSGQLPDGLLFFVMEHVEGASLASLITTGALKTGSEDVRRIGMQICDALSYAHGEGVVHRDIKPANVLMDAKGRVKVADFGLARLTGPELDVSALTMTGKIMGTLGYMAPEQLRSAAVDHRADLFALGAMLYEMLCGERAEGVFDPPSMRTGCDPRWDEIVSRAMQPDPAARYTSATELRTALDALATPFIDHQEKGRLRRRTGAFSIAAVMAGAGWLGWSQWGPGSAADKFSAAVIPKAETGAASPAAATKELPLINSLEMKFVPVPVTGGPTNGKPILFSIWETRVAEFDRFLDQQTKHKRIPTFFRQEIVHPAIVKDWDAMQDFCAWLTDTDRKAGKIGARDRYRLPTDHEWSCAVGLGQHEDAAKAPGEKHLALSEVYPWGDAWQEKNLPGNYAGEEMLQSIEGGQYRHLKSVLPNHTDFGIGTYSAGTFPANPFGLYDLGGNVWEWCDDWIDQEKTKHVLRGGSWATGERTQVLSSYRHSIEPDSGFNDYGFRCVLELAE